MQIIIAKNNAIEFENDNAVINMPMCYEKLSAGVLRKFHNLN